MHDLFLCFFNLLKVKGQTFPKEKYTASPFAFHRIYLV